MIDHEHQLSISLSGQAAWDQSGQRLLPASALFPGRSGVDASDGCVALGVSLCRQPDAARLASAGRLYRGPPACRHADEADGDDGALSASDHVAPDPGPPDLPLSVKEGGCHQAEPSLGWTSRMYPWRGGLCIWWRSSTGSAARSSRGGSRLRWRRRRAWRR